MRRLRKEYSDVFLNLEQTANCFIEWTNNKLLAKPTYVTRRRRINSAIQTNETELVSKLTLNEKTSRLVESNDLCKVAPSASLSILIAVERSSLESTVADNPPPVLSSNTVGSPSYCSGTHECPQDIVIVM